ncbi:MAG: hypothetical protein OSB00_10895 [Sphingomonas bacterium]|nr:hypothetical protein [Sphingomonas bacterium]
MSILGEYIAVLLLESANGDNNEEYGGSIPKIASRLGDRISQNITAADVEEALRILEPFAAAERDYSPLTGGFWHVKFDNFRYHFIEEKPDDADEAEAWAEIKKLAERFEVLMAYSRRGSPYAEEAEAALAELSKEEISQFRAKESATSLLGHIPASNRLVTIDHNSATFKELEQNTEKAVEAIRSSDTIDEDRRGWIRDHLMAGIELIRRHKVLATAASALLLQPLLNAYDAVTEEPAKAAILTAINAVRAYFGIL